MKFEDLKITEKGKQAELLVLFLLEQNDCFPGCVNVEYTSKLRIQFGPYNVILLRREEPRKHLSL